MKLNLRKGTFKAEWKPIKGYDGLYEVSNLGQIRSLDRIDNNKHFHKGGIKAIGINYKRRMYCQTPLYKNGKQKMFKIHRLVAEAFIPNLLNKPQIDHINTNVLNNRVYNLRWVNQSENNNNPITLQRFKNKKITEETKKKLSESHKGKTLSEETKKKLSKIRKGKKLTEETKKKLSESKFKKVYCFETNIIYESITECSKTMNICISYISSVCNGKYKSAKGYHFKFVD